MLMVAIDLIWKNNMEFNGYRQLFGATRSSEYISCSTEETKETFTGLK